MNMGYARMSTQDQTLGSQLEKLRKAGCSKIYSESGARSDRPELQRLLKALELGSVVVDSAGPSGEVYHRPAHHRQTDCRQWVPVQIHRGPMV